MEGYESNASGGKKLDPFHKMKSDRTRQKIELLIEEAKKSGPPFSYHEGEKSLQSFLDSTNANGRCEILFLAILSRAL